MFLSLFQSLTLFSAADKELLVGDVPVAVSESHSLSDFAGGEEHPVGDVPVSVVKNSRKLLHALCCWRRALSRSLRLLNLLGCFLVTELPLTLASTLKPGLSLLYVRGLTHCCLIVWGTSPFLSVKGLVPARLCCSFQFDQGSAECTREILLYHHAYIRYKVLYYLIYVGQNNYHRVDRRSVALQ